MIVPPIRLQPGDRAGRQARRVRTQQGRQRIGEIAGRNAFQVKPGQQVLDRLGPPQIGRQDRRGELQPIAVWCPIPNARNLYRNRTDPGLHLTLGQMTVTDQTAATRRIGLIGMGSEKHVQLRLDRLRDQLPRKVAQQIRQRVG